MVVHVSPTVGVWASAPRRPSAEKTTASVSAGTSRRKRWIGSQTTVPASRSALIRTSGVSLRKSSPVLDIALLNP